MTVEILPPPHLIDVGDCCTFLATNVQDLFYTILLFMHFVSVDQAI